MPRRRKSRPGVLEREIPKSVEVERQMLSALLVADDDVESDPAVISLEQHFFQQLEPEDFGDPFHAWLYEKIREARRVWSELERQIKFLLSPMFKREAREFGVSDLAFTIARMLITPDGYSCSGDVRKIRLYGNHLRRIRHYRDMILLAFKEVERSYGEWDRVVAEGGHRVGRDDLPPD